MPPLKATLFLALTAVLSLPPRTRAEEWPKYRGPQGDGIVRDEKLATEWPAEGPKKLWTIKVGIGHASPIAVDGKLYLFTRDEDKNEEALEAYDAETGKKLWGESTKGGYTHNNKDWRGTRATPVIDGDKIYTYGGSGQLICRALADGKELWKTDVLKDTKGKAIAWGQSSSPLVTNDLVYVQAGVGAGAPVAVAVNKADGKIAWRSDAKGGPKAKAKQQMIPEYGAGYAEPIIATAGGKPQLIILAGESVYGMDLATGKTLWEVEWITDYDVNATTPIYHEPDLFISSGYGHGCIMLELTEAGAKKKWENPSLASKFPQVILDRGYLYGNSEGTLRCLQWTDGKVMWQEKAKDSADQMRAGGSLVRFDDHLITLTELGKLTLAKASPEGYEKISSVKITRGSNIWATPLVYHGKLYVKGVTELICLDISAK